MMALYLGCWWFAQMSGNQTCVAAHSLWKIILKKKIFNFQPLWSFGHFFWQPTRKMPTLAKASHHLYKAFPICPNFLTCGKKSSMVMRDLQLYVWERKLVKQLWPTSPEIHELYYSVAKPSLPISIRFIILFLRELCQFAFSYYN